MLCLTSDRVLTSHYYRQTHRPENNVAKNNNIIVRFFLVGRNIAFRFWHREKV